MADGGALAQVHMGAGMAMWGSLGACVLYVCSVWEGMLMQGV
jgi:hypothetical protein